MENELINLIKKIIILISGFVIFGLIWKILPNEYMYLYGYLYGIIVACSICNEKNRK